MRLTKRWTSQRVFFLKLSLHMFIHSKSFDMNTVSHTSTTKFLEFRHLERFGVAFPDILWLWFHQAGKWLQRGHVAWPSLGTPRPYRGPGSCLALHSGEIVEFLRYSNDTMIYIMMRKIEIEWEWYEMCVWSGPRRLRWWCECRAVRSFTAFGWMVPWLSNCGRGRWVRHTCR